jgi:A/G-specific adenine glycosylase
VETALPYFNDLLKRFPTLERLAASPLHDVLKAWEGLGYYSRARNLRRAAQMVVADHHGRIPADYERFRELPGVGEYIAAAVMSLGRGLAFPVVDGNVLRVVCRWRGIDTDVRLAATRRRVRSFLEEIIPAASPGSFNESLMELGALVCLPKNPRCPLCPLLPGCRAARGGLASVLPLKSRKAQAPQYQVALAVIVRGGKLFIQQRPENGHLGGLWEFPGGKCAVDEKPEQAVVRETREELGIDIEVQAKLAEVGHAYSHFKVRLHVFVCRSRGGRIRCPRPHAWVKFAELQGYPFPAANHRFFPAVEKFLRRSRETGCNTAPISADPGSRSARPSLHRR